LKVEPRNSAGEDEKSYGTKWNEVEREVENKLLDNFTGLFETYPLQCMCEEARNNYECRTGRAKYELKKGAFSLLQSSTKPIFV